MLVGICLHPFSSTLYFSGLTDYSDDYYKNGLSDVDFLPYTTLSYANGPGYGMERPRKNLASVDTRKCEEQSSCNNIGINSYLSINI